MEEQAFISGKRIKFTVIVGILFSLGLYLASLYSYLLFHTLTELFSVVVAFGIFMFGWNSRRFLEQDYLLFLGIAYLFVAFLDMLHALAYPGMEIFRGFETNLATQLWISSRYLESVSLFAAPLFIHRKVRIRFVLVGYAALSAMMLVLIFRWRIFPDCFVEGSGLTPFKKNSEYIISLTLIGAVILLLKKRESLNTDVLQLVIASIIFTVGSELAFTFYVSPYGISNMMGHFLKVISFYLIYEAVVVSGLLRPYDLLHRDMSQTKEKLEKINRELELRMREGASELQVVDRRLTKEIAVRERANEALRKSEMDLAEAQRIARLGSWERDIADDELRWSDEVYRIFGLNPQEFRVTLETFWDRVHPQDREFVKESLDAALNQIRPYNVDHRIILPSGEERIVHEHAEVIFDDEGRPVRIVGTVQDVTEQRKTQEELKTSLNKLRKALGGIVQAMAVTVEARDPYTAGHQRRVSDLARAIAEEMHFSIQQVDGIRMAAVIHDLGKLTVPAEILSKPGKLTEMEFDMIKTHTQVGYDILKEIEFPWPIAQIVLQHHERMDGSGYPSGLSGEDILPEARIMAVADVVEAIASHRPYRPALGIDKALKEVRQNRGSLYDPEMADACLRVFYQRGFEFKE